MLTPKRNRGNNQTAPPTALDDMIVDTHDRVRRIETVLHKLALHVHMDPRTGKRIEGNDDDSTG